MKEFSALFQPGNIGSLHLENRLIMAPMGNALVDGEGYVSDRLIDYYRARASGGVGLIVTQFATISSDAALPGALALYDDQFIPGLRRLVDSIHRERTKVSVQLMHPGMVVTIAKGYRQGMSVKVPSVTPRMPVDKPYQELAEADIVGYVEDFADAACRAREAGADAVEVHACHGCLVSAFLTPATNLRIDRYGGSVENRTRFLRRIVERIRQRLGPDFPIAARINGNDDIPCGVTLGEVVQQAIILEQAGADAISVSAGFSYWSGMVSACYLLPEGPALPATEEVKKAVKIPVITANKINPEFAENLVKKGKADFIALGRPLLADPELPNKLREGRAESLRRCIYCNNCVRLTRRSCTSNPFLYREADFPTSTAGSRKKVMVIGGGVAGMQSAVFLAMRGHQVSLHEKASELGGQWNVVCRMSGKQDYVAFTDQLKRSLDRFRVRVTLGTEVTPEQVLAVKPDVAVVATGAIPRELDLPGARLHHVVQANDVIKGEAEVKGKVVVLGGRSLGIEMAIMLAEQGREVTLVSRSDLGGKKGPDEKRTYRALVRRLIQLHIPLYLNTRVLEIVQDGVIIGLGDEVFALPADTVVLAIGAKSINRLGEELRGIVPEVYVVGDCVEPRDAAEATYEAAELALKI